MKPLHVFIAAGLVATLAFAVPAFAECHTAKTGASADKINEQIVANARTDPQTGEKEASTGAAKPVENWFGCDPKSGDFNECKSVKGKQQEAMALDVKESATEKSGESKVASTPTQDCPTPKG